MSELPTKLPLDKIDIMTNAALVRVPLCNYTPQGREFLSSFVTNLVAMEKPIPTPPCPELPPLHWSTNMILSHFALQSTAALSTNLLPTINSPYRSAIKNCRKLQNRNNFSTSTLLSVIGSSFLKHYCNLLNSLSPKLKFFAPTQVFHGLANDGYHPKSF